MYTEATCNLLLRIVAFFLDRDLSNRKGDTTDSHFLSYRKEVETSKINRGKAKVPPTLTYSVNISNAGTIFPNVLRNDIV